MTLSGAGLAAGTKRMSDMEDPFRLGDVPAAGCRSEMRSRYEINTHCLPCALPPSHLTRYIPARTYIYCRISTKLRASPRGKTRLSPKGTSSQRHRSHPQPSPHFGGNKEGHRSPGSSTLPHPGATQDLSFILCPDGHEKIQKINIMRNHYQARMVSHNC